MEEPTRTLAVIVSIDAAGYSSAAEHDDERAVTVVAELRAKVAEIAARHRGRIFNTAGDGIMLEFAGADGALRAVLEMLADSSITAARARIGMHVGDIRRMPDGDLMGHGVNVAARLQALASPGTAVASAALIDLVRGQLTHGLTSLGRVRLDKMDEALEVFVLSLGDNPAAKPSPAFRRAVARTLPAWTWPAVAVAALAVTLAAIGLWTFTAPPPKAPEVAASVIAPHSIAVLPFENLSAEKENAYFAVGIQDEILTRLTKIGSLKVISRTSTAHLASTPENLPEIARKLGVAYVLEGSVQRENNAVRVSVQLIDATTDAHMWAESYDRTLTDVFSVEGEVAIEIATALNATLTSGERHDITAVPTRNAAAYEAYLRGLAFSRRINDSGRAIDAENALREAVRLDPNFGLAWAILAKTEADIYELADPSSNRKAATEEALQSAVRLRPAAQETRVAQAFVQYWVARDYAGAWQRFKVLEKEWPNDSDIALALGLIARRLGRWQESQRYLAQAVVLDPLNITVRAYAVASYRALHDFAGTLRRADEALALWPNNLDVISWKAGALLSAGEVDRAAPLIRQLLGSSAQYQSTIWNYAIYTRQYAEAISALLPQRDAGALVTAYDRGWLTIDLGDLQRLSGDTAGAKTSYNLGIDLFLAELKKAPDDAVAYDALAYAYCGLGERKLAEEAAARAVALKPLDKDAVEGSNVAVTQAYVWAFFGDADRAIPLLARLLKTPSMDPVTPATLRLDPGLDKLRSDPRFQALLTEPAQPL